VTYTSDDARTGFLRTRLTVSFGDVALTTTYRKNTP
jgi:hypothetical protein